MVISFDQADIGTGNTLQQTNASIDLNHYHSLNNWLLAVFSMLSVRTNRCIQQYFFILNFRLSCHSMYMGECQGQLCMWTTKSIVSLLGLWLCAHLRRRGTRFFSRMTSYKVVWHWKVEFVLDARWRIPKLPYLVCRYLPFAMMIIDLSRMSRNRYLKWIKSYSFPEILQRGLSIKVHHFPRMLWVKLNSKSQSCTTYFTLNSCELIFCVKWALTDPHIRYRRNCAVLCRGLVLLCIYGRPAQTHHQYSLCWESGRCRVINAGDG
jgi:hypothetical protein